MRLKQTLQSLYLLAFIAVCFFYSCAAEEPATSKRRCTATALALRPHCPDRARLTCDHFIFSPDMNESGKQAEELCFFRNKRKICAFVTTHTFSTAALRNVEPESFFSPGASLNYEDYSCIIADSPTPSQPQQKIATFDEAIAPLLNHCQNTEFGEENR